MNTVFPQLNQYRNFSPLPCDATSTTNTGRMLLQQHSVASNVNATNREMPLDSRAMSRLVSAAGSNVSSVDARSMTNTSMFAQQSSAVSQPLHRCQMELQAGRQSSQKNCAGCGERIVERTMLHSMERFWHEMCLKCSYCSLPLANASSCYIKSGMILCRNDYMRMFGHCGQCAACGQAISASEFVTRIGTGLVYHVRCFCCSKCSILLSRGDRFLLVNGAPVCEPDASHLFPHLVVAAAAANVPSSAKKGRVGRPRRTRE